MKISPKPKTKPTFELVLVTPKIAIKLKGKGRKNQRAINQNHVDFLISLQKEGVFDGNNGDLIRIDTEGTTFDGAHRLTMVEQSGIPEWMWVSTGWPVQSFYTCDQGKVRNLADFLKIDGYKNCNDLSTATYFAKAFSSKNPIMERRHKFGALQAYRWFNRNKGLAKSLPLFNVKGPSLIPRGMLMGIYHVTSKMDKDWADRCWLPLRETEGPAEHGVTILRRKLVANLGALPHNKAPRDVKMAWLIKLWNTGDLFDPRLKVSDYNAALEHWQG